VACAGGPALRTMTSADGSWQVTMRGQTPPCKLRVSGGNLGPEEVYHSVALDLGSASITPLTDLVVASLAGQAPASWWSSVTASQLAALTPAQIGAALEQVRRGLGLGALPGLDPIAAALTAAPTDALAGALAAIRTVFPDYAALLARAQGPGFPDDVRTYAAALAQALAQAEGGTSTASYTSATAPATVATPPAMSTLTIRLTAAGLNLQPVVVGTVPRPASQEAFCSEVASTASAISPSAAIPSTAGSVAIRSCAFAGNVGTIGATLTLLSPFPFSTNGVVTYTYD
jgi:hypothetical protein